jgi:hypothetical protein
MVDLNSLISSGLQSIKIPNTNISAAEALNNPFNAAASYIGGQNNNLSGVVNALKNPSASSFYGAASNMFPRNLPGNIGGVPVAGAFNLLNNFSLENAAKMAASKALGAAIPGLGPISLGLSALGLPDPVSTVASAVFSAFSAPSISNEEKDWNRNAVNDSLCEDAISTSNGDSIRDFQQMMNEVSKDPNQIHSYAKANDIRSHIRDLIEKTTDPDQKKALSELEKDIGSAFKKSGGKVIRYSSDLNAVNAAFEKFYNASSSLGSC